MLDGSIESIYPDSPFILLVLRRVCRARRQKQVVSTLASPTKKTHFQTALFAEIPSRRWQFRLDQTVLFKVRSRATSRSAVLRYELSAFFWVRGLASHCRREPHGGWGAAAKFTAPFDQRPGQTIYSPELAHRREQCGFAGNQRAA